MRRDLLVRHGGRWTRIGVAWRPQWGTGSWWAVRGIVLAWGLRLGPLGFYVMQMLTDDQMRERP